MEGNGDITWAEVLGPRLGQGLTCSATEETRRAEGPGWSPRGHDLWKLDMNQDTRVHFSGKEMFTSTPCSKVPREAQTCRSAQREGHRGR